MPEEGFKIDKTSPLFYEQVGLDKIKELSTTFYTYVYSEDVENTNSEHHSYFGKYFVNAKKGKIVTL